MKKQRRRGKKIGNYQKLFLSTVFGLMLFSCHAQMVTLHTLDSNGDAASQFPVRVPFFLEVTVNTDEASVAAPEIQGIKQFVVEEKTHVSTINTIINGNRSVQKIYRFVVHAQKEGEYQIGPAQVKINGKTEKSSTVTVKISNQQLPAKANEPLLQLQIEKERVVLGEKIACNIRFFMGKSMRLEGISQPQFPGFEAAKLEGPFTGTQIIDGQSREYVEWRTTLTPKKIGTHTIPAVSAVYKTKGGRRSHSFFGFASLFDDVFDDKQIFSNVVHITVEQLPAHTETVHGVGQFKLVQAHVQSAVAKEGEGVVYQVTVVGTGTLLDALTLKMPDGLKYYESRKFIDEKRSTDAQKVYVFEYILQGTKPGTYTIPAQKFTFFDSDKKEYQSITSNQETITIKPLAQSEKTPPKKQEEQQISQPLPTPQETVSSAESVQKPSRSLLPIVTDLYSRSAPWHFSPLLFMILVILALAPAWVIGARRLFGWYAHTYGAHVSFKMAVRKARKQAQMHINNNTFEQLYDIFVALVANKYQLSPTMIDAAFMEKAVRAAHGTDDDMSAWSRFYDALQQAKYGSMLDVHDKAVLQEGTERWLAVFERM